MATKDNGDYYHNEKTVREYYKLVADKDLNFPVEKFKKLVSPGSKLLELGIGPGHLLDQLKGEYHIIGSDFSQTFLDRYHDRNPDQPSLLLDATTLETNQVFDAIYSNKVLQHLSRQELKASLAKQASLLNPGGILFHSIWRGEGEDRINDFTYTYYTEETIKEVIPDTLQLIDIETYASSDDAKTSLLVILQKPARQV